MSQLLSLLCGFKMKKNYTVPKIYHGGDDFDLSKRWYVYYSFKHPETGKMVRQSPIFANLNRLYSTKRERLKAFKILRETLEYLLKEGYSPYEDNEQTEEYSASSALEFALDLKKSSVSTSTYNGYKNRVNVFIKYLKKKGLDTANIKSIDKKIVVEFLNEMQATSSASNRNNYRQDLSAIFTVLYENELIDNNFFDKIKKVNSKPVRNKTYSTDKVEEIFKVVEKDDPLLLLFIKVVSYNFLRPVEVVRLKAGDIDLKNKTLTVKAKNKAHKTKIIPDLLVEEFKKLDLSNKDNYLFTPKGVGKWDATEPARRKWFGNRFNKIKKKMNIGDDYTLYSFRHSFITKLYRKLRETNSMVETQNQLMLITGHSTLTALQKYLRDIDAELPDDYSDLL